MKAIIVLIAVFIFLFYSPFVKSVFAGDIIINEIMYDLSGSDTDREWIEIYNKGTSFIDLTDWRFKEGGSNHTLNQYQGSLSLDPGGFAVIVDNPTTFLNDNSGFPGTIIDSSFSLSNTGEILTILQSDLTTVSDEVTYQSSWGGAGTGGSIERKSASGGSNDSSNWQESAAGGTPGASNGFSPTSTPTPTNTPTPTPTSAATATPTKTPTPTPKPTNTPTPNKTPTPTKMPTPIPSRIPTPTVKPSTSLALGLTAASSSPILGESTQSALIISPTNAKKNPNNILISSKNKKTNSISQKIFIFAGIVFIAICVILTVRIIKKGELTQNEEE